MYRIAEPQTPMRQVAGIIRANVGPFLVAVMLLAAARLLKIATWDPQVTGITLSAIVEVSLIVAAHALATLIGCWAIISGGGLSGFRGLRALPPGRIGPFIGYAAVFNLWFLTLAAVLSRIAFAVLTDQGAMVMALAVGAVTTLTLVLMYVQLGFLFPDLVRSGQTSIFFATALGIASGRRIFGVLTLPAAVLILPYAILTMLAYDTGGMARGDDGWLWIAEVFIAAAVSALGAAAAVACAAAMTRLYLDLTQSLPEASWR